MDNWVNPDQADLRRPQAVENDNNREAVPRPWPHPSVEAAYWNSRRNAAGNQARRTPTLKELNALHPVRVLQAGRGAGPAHGLPPNYLTQVYDSINRDIMGVNTKKPDPICYIFNSAEYPLFEQKI